MKQLLTFIILTTLLLTQPACGLFGTETGNPVQPGSGSDAGDGSGDFIIPTETYILLNTLCDSVNDCIDSTEFDNSDCMDVMTTDREALNAFGANSYSSFDDVQDDIDNNNISINDTTYNNCLDAMIDESCAILGSSSVYVSGSENYSNIDKAISSQCKNVF